MSGAHKPGIAQALHPPLMCTAVVAVMNAHAAVILPSDAAGGIAVVAAIVAGDADCDVGSPPRRAEERPAVSAADGVGALRCC